MSRMTLRLPESLHQRLVQRAQAEGVSLNQYLVYALTQTASLRPVATQRSRFDALRSRVSEEEAESALAELLKSRE